MNDIAPASISEYFSLHGVVTDTSLVQRILIDDINQWYERYAINDIFYNNSTSNAAAQDLFDFITLADGWQPATDADGQTNDSTAVHFVQLGDMYELWVGLKYLFRGTPETNRVVQLADPPCRRQGGSTDRCVNHSAGACPQTPLPSAANIIGEWVDLVNENTTINIVEGNPPSSLAQFLHGATTFAHTDWLIGNHDNYLNLSQLCQTYHIPQRSEYLHENRVLMEHGHDGDIHNRFGATTGHDITQGGAFIHNLRPFTDLGADDIRRGFLEYAVKKYVGTQFDFNAFVMAHTHMPFLGAVTIAQIS